MVVFANRPTDTDLTGFWVHTIIVETFEGVGASGDVYAVPQYVAGLLEGKVVLVRDSKGQQVVSSSQFYTDTAYTDVFAPDSRVTIDGRISYVISQNRADSGRLQLPDHAAIYMK